MNYVKLTGAFKAWSDRLRHLDADTHFQSQRWHTPVGHTSY